MAGYVFQLRWGVVQFGSILSNGKLEVHMLAQEVSVRALSAEYLPDYLAFFDHDAFPPDHRWAGCYCYFPIAPHHLKPWEERAGPENRAAVSQLIRANQMNGYLAYHAGRVVGWCHAAPYTHFTILRDKVESQADQIGAITCFIVAPAYRGQGVTRQLLEAALAGFQAQGLRLAEAYPRRAAASPEARHHGPLSLYLDTGFTIVAEQDNRLIVRKTL